MQYIMETDLKVWFPVEIPSTKPSCLSSQEKQLAEDALYGSGSPDEARPKSQLGGLVASQLLSASSGSFLPWH
jgi:hypothetical protein